MSAEQIRALYAAVPDRLTRARKRFGRPLTLAEKILGAHCGDVDAQDRFEQNDRVSVTGLGTLAPGRPLTVSIGKPDGRRETIRVNHSLTQEHIGRFRAGSALNAAQLVSP